MGDVRLDHQVGVLADPSGAALFERTVDGHHFADHRVRPDLDPSSSSAAAAAAAADKLCLGSDDRAGKNPASRTDVDLALEDGVGPDFTAHAQLDARADDGTRPDARALAQFGAGVHGCGRMDFAHGSSGGGVITAVKTASATVSPSTDTTESIFQKVPRLRSSFTSMRS